MKIGLGDKVRDTISGFTGRAIARTTWLQGCNRITVQPLVKKDGTLPEGQTFDEPQLSVVSRAKVKKEEDDTAGGPIPTPITKQTIQKRYV